MLLKMTEQRIATLITYLIATVWIVNGLFCKILNWVPRHQEIVSQILGNEYSRELTVLIGISEIVMAFWIVSGYKRKLNAITQIVGIGIMNILEFILVPDLLMWGRFNSVFALLFILLIYYNQFHLRNKKIKTV
tara:strand:+ start:203 stop:604 length:402 start_codon:yes stop_codon:yes gene_type:complete